MADTNTYNCTCATIESFICGCAGAYPMDGDAILYILTKTKTAQGTEISEMTQKERDMVEIEVYKYLLRSAGMTASTQDANGTWSHKDGAVELNSIDKKHIKSQLNDLLRKYGMESTSSIRMQLYGMKVWH